MKEKNNNMERRSFTATELRAIEDEKGLRHIVGYAAVFNSLSENLGGFREKIEPGAFRDSISTDDVRALWNHDSNYILGRNKSGTLALSEDERGLKIDVSPPDTQWARDLMVSIDRGDVDKMSFGFRTLDDDWNAVNHEEVRTLKKVQLFDVSPVVFPAYPDTEVGLRSLEEYRKTTPPKGVGDGVEDSAISTILLAEEDDLLRTIYAI
jgi:hypothetical protein